MRVLRLLRADLIEAGRQGERIRVVRAAARLTKGEELVGQGKPVVHHYKTAEAGAQQVTRGR